MRSVRRWLDAKLAERRLRELERRFGALPPSDPLHRALAAAEGVLGLTPRRSQRLAAQGMREGLAVELPTGEGKSLALALTAACLALEGRHVRIAYPNDYLARRDAERFGSFHRSLAVPSSLVAPGDGRRARRQAYRQSVVHGSARDLAFDLIRDDFRPSAVWRVTTPPDALLIDEIDALLVDDAVTPLVVSRPGSAERTPAEVVDPVADRLTPDIHYERAHRLYGVQLTARGLTRAAELLRPEHGSFESSALLQLALRRALEARELWHRDEHYLVDDGRVVLIDRATGRQAPGRRLSGGLHAAIEAKERLEVRAEPVPSARSSHRTILSRYGVVGGCSATLAEVAEPLEALHGLATVVIPSGLTSLREDHPDRFHPSDAAKLNALVERTEALHREGRPVLLYAPSDAEARHLGDRLAALEARTLGSGDERHEVAVLSTAGAEGAVTVATRLASRGTHIRLGPDPESAERVRAAGGLAVVLGASPEDHRLERQIRGRAGRQGDPGSTELHVSPGDPLFRRHSDEEERRRLAAAGPDEAAAIHEHARQRAMSSLENGRVLRARIDTIADGQARAHVAFRSALLVGSPDDVTTPEPAIEAEARVAVGRLLRVSRLDDRASLPVRRLARDLYRLTGVWIPAEDLRDGPVERTALERVACSLTNRWHRLRDMSGAEPVRERVEREGYRRVLVAAQRLHLTELDEAWAEHLLLLSHLEATLAFRTHVRGDPIASLQRDAHQAFLAIRPAVEGRVVDRLLSLPPLDPPVLQALILRPFDREATPTP